MTDPIHRTLEERGIEVDLPELARAVDEALAAAGGVPPYPAPSEALTEEQLGLLAEGGFEIQGPELGLADPVVRAALESAALRATALPLERAAARLGVGADEVEQRLGDRTLYGLEVDGQWRLPLFQFAGEKLVPGIERVIPHLDPSLAPIAVLRWFASPNPDLASPETNDAPVSPLVWLRRGLDPKPVAELADDL